MFAISSQSGGTPETRNGLLEVQQAFREAGLDFAKQVLISGSCFCFCDFPLLLIKGFKNFSFTTKLELSWNKMLQRAVNNLVNAHFVIFLDFLFYSLAFPCM